MSRRPAKPRRKQPDRARLEGLRDAYVLNPNQSICRLPTDASSDCRLRPTDLLVLIELGRFCDKDGNNCYPAVGTIAERLWDDAPWTRDSQVRKSLRNLERLGYITLLSDGRGGARRTNHYTINLNPFWRLEALPTTRANIALLSPLDRRANLTPLSSDARGASLGTEWGQLSPEKGGNSDSGGGAKVALRTTHGTSPEVPKKNRAARVRDTHELNSNSNHAAQEAEPEMSLTALAAKWGLQRPGAQPMTTQEGRPHA